MPLAASCQAAPGPPAPTSHSKDFPAPLPHLYPSPLFCTLCLWGSWQALGVESTSATKAAFLGQVTAVMTPALASATGQTVSSSQWASCVVALVGSTLIAWDGLEPSELMEGSARSAGPVAHGVPCAAHGGAAMAGGYDEMVAACADADGSKGLAEKHLAILDAVSTSLPPASTSGTFAEEGCAEAAVSGPASEPGLLRVASEATDIEATLLGGALDGEACRAGPHVGSAVAAQAAALSLPDVGADAGPGGHPGLGGEALVLAACVFYALATVRLSYHAPRCSAVHLAASKTVVETAASLAWLVCAPAWHSGQGVEASGAGAGAGAQLSSAWPSGVALAVLVYSALGPGAGAAILQSFGQAQVPVAQAQVLYSLTPIWSALLAGGALTGEAMGAAGWLGAAIILGASLSLAAAEGSEQASTGNPPSST
jgi:drug/metabolite transporter (DMT)-like permease